MRRQAGFTLMEVMIAVIIMAIGLSSLFASEAGAIRIAQRARTTTIASLLARCKMGEIEEKLGKEGWPGSALDDRDECCDGAEHKGFRCEWKVERIVLPESSEGKTEAEAKDALDKVKGGQSGSSSSPGGGAPIGAPQDPLSSMGIPLNGMPSILGGSGGGTGGGLGGAGGGSGTFSSGGMDPISGMVMDFAFPIMKPIIEEQVRRVTVSVYWTEGEKEQTFDVVQFLVNEAPFLPNMNDEDDNAPPPATGMGTQTATPPTAPATK
ncbi:MAG: prepilin-type N-terminal cleavage/methylation domain-containing protein [Myxococcales bacterium]